MELTFYLTAVVAVIATVNAVTRCNAVHALLYLIVSLFAVAVIFFLLGAPFAAALEVIIYAGAIMVLFVFVIMMMNPGPESIRQEKKWLPLKVWIGPGFLALILLMELVYLISGNPGHPAGVRTVSAQEVGISLFGPYLVGVELASLLLLTGLVGAYHLGRRHKSGIGSKGGPS